MYASNSFKVQVSMHIVSNVWVYTICAVLKDSIILWYNKLRVQQQCNTSKLTIIIIIRVMTIIL